MADVTAQSGIGFARRSFLRLFALGVTMGFVTFVQSADTNDFAARAAKAFLEAEARVRKEPTNVTALIELSASAFNRAEFAQKSSERAEIANEGVDAAREAIHLAPTNAAPRYWLAMNFGQLARTKTLGALHLVRRMEDEFKQARALDPHVDYAGPDRSLGYLYRDAPGWPTSIGSRKKAREHLERAVQLHPEFPDNQLALLESFDQWDDAQNFRRVFPAVEKCLSAARSRFSGPEWEQSWADWQKRWTMLKSKASR